MRLLRAAIGTGLAGGALDIVAACLIYPAVYPKYDAVKICQTVAAGLIGREKAFAGGLQTPALGLAAHFFIALCAGAALIAVMSRAALFRRLWIVSGAVYGVAMYYFMQRIVLPLSATGAQHPDLRSMAIGLGIHVFIFGLGSAFVAQSLLRKR